MRTLAAFTLLAVICGPLAAEDKEPRAARTSTFVFPAQHTPEGTGTVKPLSRLATGGISSHESGGYIGGGKLVRGEGRGVTDGTFGWDYTFFGRRPGRIFLGWYNDGPQNVMSYYPKYNAEGRRVTDVVALMPFKKAVREAKEEKKADKEGKPGGEH